MWTHIGRFHAKDEPYLAVDAGLRDAWRGLSKDHYDQVVHLPPDETGVPVGAGRGVLVGGAGRGDGWVEVFRSGGAIAFVQAAGADDPRTLRLALDHSPAEDRPGEPLVVASGELAVFRAAGDGDDGSGLLLRTGQVTYRHRICRHERFSRWLFVPVRL